MPNRPACKIHGGKYYLAKWVMQHAPPDYLQYDYHEACFGMGSVLVNKIPSPHEVAIDTDPGAIAIHTAIKQYPVQLMDNLRSMPYTEKHFETIKAANEVYYNRLALKVNERKSDGMLYKSITDHLRTIVKATGTYNAECFLVGFAATNYAVRRMSRGGAPGDVNSWATSIENIRKLHQRYRNVVFFNMGCITYLRWRLLKYPSWVYFDPPYVHSTRHAGSIRKRRIGTATKQGDYRCEGTEKLHTDILDLVTSPAYAHNKFLISGYDNAEYNQRLLVDNKGQWRRVDLIVSNHSAQSAKKSKKIESLWMNY